MQNNPDMNMIIEKGVFCLNITQQTENTICIELTQDDMTQLDITYDELDYSNIETRRVLWTLLDEAKHKLGKNISLAQKMLIEALPDEKGGCTLFFTVTDAPCEISGKKQLIKQQATSAVCQSEKLDDLCDLASVLRKMDCTQKSELYFNGKNYRMIIYPKNHCHNINNVVTEFGILCEKDAESFTAEHYKLLASPDAVEVLSLIK